VITRQIVEAHGGALELGERSPRGTSVTLRLPRRAAFPRAPSAVDSPSSEAPLSAGSAQRAEDDLSPDRG
jgi:hypothetical protein